MATGMSLHGGDRETLRLGIVGTGDVAGSHSRAILGVAAEVGIELAAVADSDRQRAKRFADREAGGCLAYGSLDEMAARQREIGKRLDAVVLAVPDEIHSRLAVEAMRQHRLAVLVEKPPATTIADADAIARASEETGLPVLLGLVYLHGIHTAEPDATGDELGHRYFTEAHWLRRRGLVSWRKKPSKPFDDLGAHLVGVAMHVHRWPTPTWISARSFGHVGPEAMINTAFGEFANKLDPTAFRGVDTTLATIDFHNPARRWTVHTAFLGNYEINEAIDIRIFGALAGIDIPIVAGERDPRDYPPRKSYERHGSLRTEQIGPPFPHSAPEAFAWQMRHFAQVVRRDAEPIAGPREIRILQRILVGVERSVELLGRQVDYTDL